MSVKVGTGFVSFHTVNDGADGTPGYVPVKGVDYFDGKDGQNGQSSYIWIRYSQYATGASMVTSPTDAKYIGIATTITATAPTTASAYSWTLIKGTDGIPGEKGIDGKTSYLHIKYSDDNATFTANGGETVGKYIGTYVDFTEADSNTFAMYTWNRVRGQDGYTPVKGTDYFDGVDGQDGKSSYIWVRYSQNANGNPMTDSPTNAKYIGVATTETSVAPTSYSVFSWTLIKGTDGLPGEKGIDGKTSYLHIKYSNDGGSTFTANSGESTGAWIGTYVDFIEADSSNVASYTWNKVKGEKGDQGPQGVEGPKGVDGTTLYTWIKYADSPTSGMSDFPVGKAYVGFSYNNLSSNESQAYADYSWSLIKGTDGVPGQNGTDGVTTYTWVKYADDANGAGMSDLSTGKRFLGLAYNKTTPTETTNPADYSWSPLYDNVVVGGRNYISKLGNGVYDPAKMYDTDENLTEQIVIAGKTWLRFVTTGTFRLSSIPVEPNTQYTYSFDAFHEVAAMSLSLRAYYLGGYGEMPINVGTTPKRVSGTFTSKANATYDIAHIYGITIGLHLANFQLEKGNVASDYNPAPEDVVEDYVNKVKVAKDAADAANAAAGALETALGTEEEARIEHAQQVYDDAVLAAQTAADAVVDSEKFLQALSEKADAEALGNLVTKDELSLVNDTIDTRISDGIAGMDLSDYATGSDLAQLDKDIKDGLVSTLGSNLLRNSIGYAGIDYWERTTVNEGIVSIMNEQLSSINYGSGFYFTSDGQPKGIQQTVNVTAGETYTFSWLLNKAKLGDFEIAIYEDGNLKMTIPDISGVNGMFNPDYINYVPETAQMTVRLSSTGTVEATITAIMLNAGKQPTKWGLAHGELYNAYVRVDESGLRVIRIDENGVIEGYTNMTPEEFAGYYDENRDGQFERIFWFNRDETVTKKIRALEEITMGTIKALRVNTPLSRGWAFVGITDQE